MTHDRRRSARGQALALVLLVASALTAREARAASSLAAWQASSPDDLSGFTTLSGNDSTANVTLPFTFTIEGTGYTTLAISTNGWIEVGSNTSGGPDPHNPCLPAGNHTNPFLAVYWDDIQTQGTNIRYVTVGASPHRTFIVDGVEDVVAQGGSDVIHYQVQLHETSNVITVKYISSQGNVNGQAATIGYQGAGGASATTVQPLTCNGKILDDNRSDEGWSVDVGRTGLVTLAAQMESSPDDNSGFTTLSGLDNLATVTLPFTVTLEGTAYSTLAISTNGWLEFGGNSCTSCGTNNADSTNAALPTSKHTRPLVAAYWDDSNPFGNAIRYGTVGTSPNRTFIVDYQVDIDRDRKSTGLNSSHRT